MFRNHFRLAVRHLLKERQFTLLNLAGLSTGLAGVLLIFLWVRDEWRIDKFHQHDHELYQVLVNDRQGDRIVTGDGTGGLLGETLGREMPEVEYAVTTTPANWFQQFNIAYGNNALGAAGNFAGKDYFKVFSYPLLQGNPATVLADKNAIVLSESLARKIFHTTENITGKVLQWKWLYLDRTCVVTGVYRDMPAHSTSRLDFILPLDAWKEIVPATQDVQGGPFNTYLVVKKGTDMARFNAKMGAFLKSRFEQATGTLFLRKYSDGYLYGKYENGVQAGGRIVYVELFCVIALFILVIACINFMNLSTAKVAGRIKEVGVKKTLGAGRRTLVLQFLGESVLMAFSALLVALLLVMLLLPRFNEITGKQLSLHLNITAVAAILGITLFTGLLAGSYPAFYLSRFRPAITLKGKIPGIAGELWTRKGLVVFQFVVSVVFIIAVMVVHGQLKFVQTKSPGYNKDNVVYFEMEGRVADKGETFLAELKNIPGVANASSIQQNIILPAFVPGPGVQWDGENTDDKIRFYQMPVNYDLIETLNIGMAAGRSFSRQFRSDTNSVILNEAAVKAMGLTNPIGKVIQLHGKGKEIIGVARNFHFNSLHEEIRPFIFWLSPSETMLVMARLHAGRETAALEQIRAFYKKFNPGFSFDYKFLDNDYQAQYAAEKLVASLSGYFAGLAVLISCLGLFGLAAFTAQRKQKEIGIRKVLGATVTSIAVMLSRDFLKLIVMAVLIAFPLSWWIMGQWLNGFAYRVQLGAGVFLAAGAAALLITLLTVSAQAVKAGMANPVKSLDRD